MKRLCSFLAALLLIPCLCAGVQAAASAQIVRAFVSEGCLYTYVDLSGNEQPITKAEARIGSASFPSLGRLETVRQAGSSPTRWSTIPRAASPMRSCSRALSSPT